MSYFFSLLFSSYTYNVRTGVYQHRRPLQMNDGTPVTITAGDIESETKAHWFIIRPSIYHDRFFQSLIPADRQIPTQVTGAIAEAVTVRVFRQLYNADRVEKISERPDSQTADFSMDIDWNQARTHALVESKGSNTPGGWSMPQLYNARDQLDLTEAIEPNVGVKLVSLVSFRPNRVELIEIT